MREHNLGVPGYTPSHLDILMHVVRLKEAQSPAVYNYIIICIFKLYVLPQLASLPFVNKGIFLFLEHVSSTSKDVDYSWVYL